MTGRGVKGAAKSLDSPSGKSLEFLRTKNHGETDKGFPRKST